MSEDDVLAAYKSGHEIADHTFNHVDATTITPQALEKEINKLIEKRFIGARGITGRIHTHSVDLNQINSNRLYADDSYTELLSDISSLKTTSNGKRLGSCQKLWCECYDRRRYD